jgi:hypothetical protein
MLIDLIPLIREQVDKVASAAGDRERFALLFSDRYRGQLEDGVARTLATIYAESFTLEELVATEQFYGSEIGRSVNRKQAALQPQIMQGFYRELAPLMQRIALENPGLQGQSRPVVPQIKQETGLSTRPIPPSAGFTADFEDLYRRPESANEEIVSRLRPQLDRLTYPYLYEYARRVAATAPEDAIVVFWRAGIRARYDALRCTDQTARQGTSFWPSLVPKVVELLRSPAYKDRSRELLLRAADLEERANISYEPSTICFHGMAAMQAGLENRQLENWHIPRGEWPKIHEQVLANARHSADRPRSN